MKKVSLFIATLVVVGATILGGVVMQPAQADSGKNIKCVMDGYTNNVQNCKAVGDIGWYVTTSGDTINIYCAKPDNTLAKQCIFMTYNANNTPQQYCRVNLAGKINPMRCAKVAGVTNKYRTISGDSKVIQCNNVAKPYATGCTFVPIKVD